MNHLQTLCSEIQSWLTTLLKFGKKRKNRKMTGKFKILNLLLRVTFTHAYYSTIKFVLTLNPETGQILQKKSSECSTWWLWQQNNK